MAREYEPIEESLIHQAASDALQIINGMSEEPRVNKFIQCGDTTFSLHLSIVSKERMKMYADNERMESDCPDREKHCWHWVSGYDVGMGDSREDHRGYKCCYCGKTKHEVAKGRSLLEMAADRQHGPKL